MKERPIQFRDWEVRAILEGRKTQLRRVVKPQPDEAFAVDYNEDETVRERRSYSWSWAPPIIDAMRVPVGHEYMMRRCPFGQPGDRLWVRETHFVQSAGYADGTGRLILYRASDPNAPTTWDPSIHMPRWASRLTLEVKAVRVERLQEIGEADAKAEGVVPFRTDTSGASSEAVAKKLKDWYPEGYAANFELVWDSLNAKRGFGWDANPFVWVVEFQRVAG